MFSNMSLSRSPAINTTSDSAGGDNSPGLFVGSIDESHEKLEKKIDKSLQRGHTNGMVEGEASNRDDDDYFNVDKIGRRDKLEDGEEKENQKKTQVLSLAADAAMKFIFERKQVYKNQERAYSWPLRGIGYLFEQHGIVLAGKYAMTNNKKHAVHIYNVHEGKEFNCSDIVIWVRVNGTKEIFAGRAGAVHSPVSSESVANHTNNDDCHWEFPFDATISGSYSIDAKLLEWNPNVPKAIECPVVTTNSSIVEPFPVKTSFLGFKMYHVKEMCCEICSRLEGYCKAWATPIPAFPRGNVVRQGCELYFENETSLGVVPISPMIKGLNATNETEFHVPADQYSEKVYGLPHHNGTSYFLGCGWSYWFTLDFPCLSGAHDDAVFFSNNRFELSDADLAMGLNEKAAVTLTNQDNTTVRGPLCTIESESFANHSGRWYREPWPNDEECSHPYETTDKPMTFADGSISKIDWNDDPKCFRRDDHISFYDRDCIEMNCAMIDRSSLWNSWFHEERHWNGHWKHDSGCTYSQHTDNELQHCFNRRKLYGFNVDGLSIAGMIRGYLTQRFENITFYNNTELGGGTKVTISTFQMLHYCSLPDSALKKAFADARNISENEEFLWVSGYFLSSERELACFASRIKEFSMWGEEILTPKGYKMINAYDMTAAMTYDTAAQHDGMHINGPPLRMILTKILHYLCSDE